MFLVGGSLQILSSTCAGLMVLSGGAALSPKIDCAGVRVNQSLKLDQQIPWPILCVSSSPVEKTRRLDLGNV